MENILELRFDTNTIMLFHFYIKKEEKLYVMRIHNNFDIQKSTHWDIKDLLGHI